MVDASDELKQLFLQCEGTIIPRGAHRDPRNIARPENIVKLAARIAISLLPPANVLFPSGI